MRKTKKLAALMLAGRDGGIPAACEDRQQVRHDSMSPQTAKKAKRQSRQQMRDL